MDILKTIVSCRKQRQTLEHKADLIFCKKLFRGVKKFIVWVRSQNICYQNYDHIFYIRVMRHAWGRLCKEKRLNGTFRKVQSQSQLHWLRKWHVIQAVRIRARACIKKMLYRSTLGAIQLLFIRWKKDTLVERKLEEGMRIRQYNITKKAMDRLLYQRKLKDWLILADRCSEWMVAVRVLRRLHLFLSVNQAYQRKIEYGVTGMNKVHMRIGLANFYLYRCNSIADRLFRRNGRSWFFKQIKTYWSLVTRDQNRMAYVLHRLPYLGFVKFCRRLRKIVRSAKLLRKSDPFYTECLLRRHFRRLMRVARYNSKARRWYISIADSRFNAKFLYLYSHKTSFNRSVAFDSFHLRRKLLRAIHRLDILKFCGWGRQHLARLQLIDAKVALYKRIFHKLMQNCGVLERRRATASHSPVET